MDRACVFIYLSSVLLVRAVQVPVFKGYNVVDHRGTTFLKEPAKASTLVQLKGEGNEASISSQEKDSAKVQLNADGSIFAGVSDSSAIRDKMLMRSKTQEVSLNRDRGQSLDAALNCKIVHIYMFDYGGDEHANMDHDERVSENEYNNYVVKYRPEDPISMKCTDGVCGPCETPSDCFQPLLVPAEAGTNKPYHGVMDLQVPWSNGMSQTSYKLEVYFDCGADGLTQTLRVRAMFRHNGVLTVFGDGSNVGTWSDDSTTPLLLHEKVLLNKNKYHLRITWQPGPQSKNSALQVHVSSQSSSKSTFDVLDACMSGKLCLKLLQNKGDTPGYRIRNSPALQLECLRTGKAEGHEEPCKEWRTCLEKNGQKVPLRILLKGIEFVNPSLFIQNKSSGEDVRLLLNSDSSPSTSQRANHDSIADDEGCVQPLSSDPEEWECNCAVYIDQECGATGDAARKQCVWNLMCGFAKICRSWKVSKRCPGYTSLVEQEQLDTPKPKALMDRVVDGPMGPSKLYPKSVPEALMDRKEKSGSKALAELTNKAASKAATVDESLSDKCS